MSRECKRAVAHVCSCVVLDMNTADVCAQTSRVLVKREEKNLFMFAVLLREI